MDYKKNTNDNYEEIVKCFVEELRKRYTIGTYDLKNKTGIVEKMCNECDRETWRFCGKRNYGYESIWLNNLGIQCPFHRASLVGFNTQNGPKWYLVDPTYGQFFEEEKFRDYIEQNYEKFSDELLKKGYIECTILNMLSYINGFIYSNAFIKGVNAEEVYDKLESLLLSNNIVNKDLTNTEKRLVELLKLKQELLAKQKEHLEIKTHS